MFKALRTKIQFAHRKLTSDDRVLPDFIIAGAQKSGTSSLYDYLSEHPQILPAVTKEVHFFDKQYAEGLAHYRASFPRESEIAEQSSRVSGAVLTGEATPYYMFHPHAMKRIAADLPECRIIVLLREPVERAYSGFHQSLRYGFDSRSLQEAIDTEDVIYRAECEKLEEDPLLNSHSHQRHSYIARGRYVEQLERIFGMFPREQVLVLESGAFFSEPETVTNRVCDFLDLPPVKLQSYSPKHTTKNRGLLDDELRTTLREYYAPWNEKLFDLLGERFDW